MIVVTTPEADADILRLDAWWRENRPLAPDLFAEELAEAFSVVGEMPALGRPYLSREVAGVRRLLLRTTRHHIYYRIGSDAVIVLRVWGSVLGRGPALS
jgi:plasmid stabilization system protein ParE